jgi:hypothetical protein
MRNGTLDAFTSSSAMEKEGAVASSHISSSLLASLNYYSRCIALSLRLSLTPCIPLPCILVPPLSSSFCSSLPPLPAYVYLSRPLLSFIISLLLSLFLISSVSISHSVALALYLSLSLFLTLILMTYLSLPISLRPLLVSLRPSLCLSQSLSISLPVSKPLSIFLAQSVSLPLFFFSSGM